MADELFDERFAAVKQKAHATEDVGLSARDLKEISERFLWVVEVQTGRPFPDHPYQQLEIAIKAVFDPWMGKRAVDYRREFHITPDMAHGTAVSVCTMVFGNGGDDSATGVAFTDNPGTGENKLFGEYLVNAQGEDVVAGIRTPRPIEHLGGEMPAMARQLEALRCKLDAYHHEVQGLRVHHGARHPALPADPQRQDERPGHGAQLGGDGEGGADRQGAGAAACRSGTSGADAICQARPQGTGQALAQGLPASPGAACGHAVFDADRAETLGKEGNG